MKINRNVVHFCISVVSTGSLESFSLGLFPVC